MKKITLTSFLASIALSLLLVNCGSGTKTDNKGIGANIENNTSIADDNQTDDNTQNPIVAGYSAEEGILIETRSDGTKRAWVNAQGTQCLIYRLAQHPNTTILGGGTDHCDALNHGGISVWRLPSEEEAVYFMSHVPASSIVYPTDNPDCRFMATTSSVAGNEGRFVYTTNETRVHPNNVGAFNNFDAQGKTRGTAGIRCVATQ